ncbi:MAG: Photosystem I P700 chlorophyll a apoprotein A2 [Firmicutes bacterium]|nr:Photosystem I P700 chlorophyll a apoprotein A2 [candidate division NPL-UPA2 bacterium]
MVKFRRFLASFQGVGVLDGGTTPNTTIVMPEENPNEVATEQLGPFWADSGRMMTHVQEYLESQGIEAEVRAFREERGVLLELQDRVLFDSGQATLRQDGLTLLGKLVTLFSEMPNEIAVEGHTDNVPINTPEYPSNWELSAARSARVVRYFVEIRGLTPERFSAIGYGEFRPVDSNATAVGRSRNRRVVFVIRGI